MSRKNAALLVGERVSPSCRLDKSSDGELVIGVQLMRSKLCSKSILVEGTIHERLRLLLADETFNCGAGGVCDTQTPPYSLTAANSLPSADAAIEVQVLVGPLEVQLTPRLVETQRVAGYCSCPMPPPKVNNVEPSAEDTVVA